MKWAHRVEITVFVKPEDVKATVHSALNALVPFDLENEKLLEAQGSDEGRPIEIASIVLKKEAHTNGFLRFLLDRLGLEQRELLASQDDRLHEDEGDWNFYLRIDKSAWVNDQRAVLTDSGDCFHVKIMLAVFPKKREVALALVKKLLQ